MPSLELNSCNASEARALPRALLMPAGGSGAITARANLLRS